MTGPSLVKLSNKYHLNVTLNCKLLTSECARKWETKVLQLWLSMALAHMDGLRLYYNFELGWHKKKLVSYNMSYMLSKMPYMLSRKMPGRSPLMLNNCIHEWGSLINGLKLLKYDWAHVCTSNYWQNLIIISASFFSVCFLKYIDESKPSDSFSIHFARNYNLWFDYQYIP